MDKLTAKEWHALVAAVLMANDMKTAFQNRAGAYGIEGLESLIAKIGSGQFQR